MLWMNGLNFKSKPWCWIITTVLRFILTGLPILFDCSTNKSHLDWRSASQRHSAEKAFLHGFLGCQSKYVFFFHRNHCMHAVLLHNTYQKKKKQKKQPNIESKSRHFVVELRSDEELCPKNCLVCCSRLAAKLTGTQLLIITIISPSVRCGVTCLAHIAFWRWCCYFSFAWWFYLYFSILLSRFLLGPISWI